MDEKRLDSLASEFKTALDARLAGDYGCEFGLPSREAAAQICRRYLDLLFPVFYSGSRPKTPSPASPLRHYLVEVDTILREQLCAAIRFDRRCQGNQSAEDIEELAQDLTERLFQQLPELAALLGSDIEAAFRNDPAAPSQEAILLSYPCIEAITVQRLAHRLYLAGVPFLPRMMTEVAHSHTGIDINPGAAIGDSFFIDHGTGVVIGETATIGCRVTLYHGVTWEHSTLYKPMNRASFAAAWKTSATPTSRTTSPCTLTPPSWGAIRALAITASLAATSGSPTPSAPTAKSPSRTPNWSSSTASRRLSRPFPVPQRQNNLDRGAAAAGRNIQTSPLLLHTFPHAEQTQAQGVAGLHSLALIHHLQLNTTVLVRYAHFRHLAARMPVGVAQRLLDHTESGQPRWFRELRQALG